MTVFLVSISVPLPAASARYLRSVFFELEVVYSPSILVARILLVISQPHPQACSRYSSDQRRLGTERES